MKKLLLGACAVLAMAATSCDKCGGDSSCATAANDSLSMTYGQYVGTMVSSEFDRYTQNAGPEARKSFMKGFQYVAGNDMDKEARMGMQIALNVMNELSQMKEEGIEIDPKMVMSYFKSTFMADSIDPTQAQFAGVEFRTLFEKARREAAERKEAEKAQAPDAQANVKAGNDYVAKLKADNQNVQKLPSGLVYVIETEGEGDKPSENATVVVNYTGKHLDGTVFDSSKDRGPATFNLQGVVPGFREGLMQLGKGGKATLYIPGALGYGINGQPNAGIGPNEMLVFDVELVDINAE